MFDNPVVYYIIEFTTQRKEGNRMASDAQIRASVNHNKKMGSITIRPSKELDQEIRAAAQAAGESLTTYILEAVRRRMEQEQQGK